MTVAYRHILWVFPEFPTSYWGMQYGVALLGQLPLDIRIREQTDSGRPTVVAEPDSPLGRTWRDLARRTSARLSLSGASAFPSITVEET